MNESYKKSLLFCFFLSVIYVTVFSYPSFFIWEFGSLAFITIVFWFSYFGVKPKLNEIFENSKFLIIPILFNLGAMLFISTFFQSYVKALFSFAIIIANLYLTVALKKIYNLREKAAIFQRNVVISISFLSIFFSTAALFRFYVQISITQLSLISNLLVTIAVFAVFYLVSYFLGWQSGTDLKKFYPYNLVNALIGAEFAWVGMFWVVNYPTFGNTGKMSLGGVPLPAVALTIIFYFLWGIISQKVEKNLTRQVLTEYFLITMIFLLALIVTAHWLPIS